ncbi:MAG: M55 family metallopeptidase [Armatimonadota bacterium]|nr:MAG: M55 family metallopeptidase [Armatimonadota bacterium]
MKIYISCDLEGAAGVWQAEHGSKGTREYEEARRLLTAEVCAAVEGARDGGADDIIVADMHGGSGHLLIEQMPAGIRILEGVPHAPRFPFLDESVDAMFLIAYHAMAGTPGAVLVHTMMGTWQEFRANGRVLGEVGIDAAIAGCVGVPVALVTGDDKVCAEACALLGDIETAEVKQGIGATRALLLSPPDARALIRERAAAAVAKAKQLQPFDVGSPVDIRIRLSSIVAADAATRDDAQRVDPLTVRWAKPLIADYFGGLWPGPAR